MSDPSGVRTVFTSAIFKSNGGSIVAEYLEDNKSCTSKSKAACELVLFTPTSRPSCTSEALTRFPNFSSCLFSAFTAFAQSGS